MVYKKYIISLFKWLTTTCIAIGLVLIVRYFGMESYHISTDSMEEALHKGDYILVNKLPLKDNPGRNRVVLFTSPLLKDTVEKPLFLSRCIGMPGDTIQVSSSGYSINGRQLPHAPQSLSTYFVTKNIHEEFMRLLRKLSIPLRNHTTDAFGFYFRLTTFEEYQLREELSEEARSLFVKDQTDNYTLIIPRKGQAYRLDKAALTACKEAIQAEAGKKAVFSNDKLYMDGRETSFFFFDQDYYWMLSDNTNEAVDSRHLGFIPRNHIIGNAWFCWFSHNKQQLFKPVH